MTAISPNSGPSLDVDLTDVRNQRGIILSILCDFLEEDRIADLGDWLDHVGFDLTVIRYAADLPAAGSHIIAGVADMTLTGRSTIS